MRERETAAVSGAYSIAPPWSDATALGGSAFKIRLGGTFESAWLARLCRGLAGHRVSIQRAHAMRALNRVWSAELHVFALPGAPAVESLPIVPLLAAEQPASGPLQLEGYSLAVAGAHGGTLHLTIEAPDTLGLLGSLLAQLAALDLYPLEMHIETCDGRAEDSLWLYTDRGGRPTPAQQDALERALAAATPAR